MRAKKHSFQNKTSNSFIENGFPFKQSFQMDRDALTKLGSVLRSARKAKGLGLKDVGEAAGTSPQAVGQWERGENGPSMAKLIVVGRLLGIDIDAAMRGEHAASSQPHTAEVAPAPEFGDPRSRLGAFDLPVLGVTLGGRDDDRGPDFWLNGETVSHVARPRKLEGRTNVFALYVDGDSMEPKDRARDLVVVEKANPAPGDDVVIELKPARSDDAEHDNPSFLKQLVARRGSFVTVRQFNPPKEIEFDLKEIKNLFRVIPLKELMG